jgi:hypothetical protein
MIFFWLIFLLLASFILNKMWRGILSGGWYALFLFPGIIIHELSHLIGCFLTGAKVTSFCLFSFKGGYVRHSKPKLPLIGQALISVAPVVGGIGSLWLASYYLGIGITKGDFPEMVRSLFDSWTMGWPFWLFIYLAITIVICLVPSKQDVKVALGGLILLLIIAYFLRDSFLVDILILGSVISVGALIVTIPLRILKVLFN